MKIPILPVVVVALLSLLALHTAQGAAVGHSTIYPVITQVLALAAPQCCPSIPWRSDSYLLAVLWQLEEKLGS